jgi:hypothetical protein
VLAAGDIGSCGDSGDDASGALLEAVPGRVLGVGGCGGGDGALAWCAVARAREVDPDHSLARLVADLLEAAVPPDSWEARSSRWGSAS